MDRQDPALHGLDFRHTKEDSRDDVLEEWCRRHEESLKIAGIASVDLTNETFIKARAATLMALGNILPARSHPTIRPCRHCPYSFGSSPEACGQFSPDNHRTASLKHFVALKTVSPSPLEWASPSFSSPPRPATPLSKHKFRNPHHYTNYRRYLRQDWTAAIGCTS